MHSSSFGPTSRALLNASLRRPCLKDNALATSCVRLKNRLPASSKNKMMATIIQPRLLRGLGAGGGMMTGGGGSGGGGGTNSGTLGGVSMRAS